MSKRLKIILVGWGEESRYLYRLLREYGQETYEIRGGAEEDSARWNVMDDGCRIGSFGGAARLWREKKADFFLIPSVRENPNGWSLFEKLALNGIPEEAALYAPVEIFQNPALSGPEKLARICPYGERRELDYMEIHVADHCNLNCKNCSMFSGLLKEPVFANFEETARGIRRLRQFFDHIKTFRVLGGEPLLNPELPRYLTLIRELYPYTDIRVISNGILVEKMSGGLLECLRKNEVSFIVTEYPALEGIADRVGDFLRAHHIRHVVGPTVRKFQKIYNAAGDSDVLESFCRCQWKNTCANLKGSRIATCFVPFVLPYLARQFSLALPEDETIDLFDEGLSAKEIRRRMNRPMEMCRFCTVETIFADWALMDGNSAQTIRDWSV